MENKDFLAPMKLVNPEDYAACLAAMEKYGENHWWEDGTNDRMFAYYQLNEDRYLSKDPARLGNALSSLIGLPVYGPHVELHPANLEFLRDEAERAWKHGTEASEASTTEVETVDQIRKEVPMFQVFKKAFGKEEEEIYSGDDVKVAEEQVSACKGNVERVQTKVNGAWTHNPKLSWDDYEQYRKDLKAGKFDAGFERDERNV